MNKKTGFTLVELLAVIAILAVILLLIVPNIVDMFNNGKKDAFIRQVQAVWRESEKEYTNDLTSETVTQTYSDSETNIGRELKLNKTDITYVTGLDEHGSIIFIAVGNKNFCYISNNPQTMDLDRTQITDSSLNCSNGVCTCGNITTEIGSIAEKDKYVYWDYSNMDLSRLNTCLNDLNNCEFNSYLPECYYDALRNGTNPNEISKQCMTSIVNAFIDIIKEFTYKNNTYPSTATESYDGLSNVFFRTTLNAGKAKKHEVCTRSGSDLLCLDNTIFNASQDNTLETYLRNNSKTDIMCKTKDITQTSSEDSSAILDKISELGLTFIPTKMSACKSNNNYEIYEISDKGIYGIIKAQSEEAFDVCFAIGSLDMYACVSQNMLNNIANNIPILRAVSQKSVTK